MTDFKLILVDPNMAMCYGFEEHFHGLPNVEIVNDRFERLPAFDCMVSAANSFGLMDGGVDLAITNFFGEQLQERVQRRILSEFRGEQPIGTSLIVETRHAKHPYIAHTPTMRVPMYISKTDNVYTAMWAMLLAVHHFNTQVAANNQQKIAPQKIKIVACPGLGTGVGRMGYSEAARQMSLAYRKFLNPPTAINWPYATKRQADIRRGGDFWLSVEPEEE
jgi:O-acetyl-ADP-ribose deacetylase (regulator of RNase III)